MTTPALDVVGATKAHRSVPLWTGIDLAVAPGSALAITGPSGCGKSTLLRCLGLLDRVDSGRITMLGEDVTRLSSRRRTRLYRTAVGHVFQNAALEDTWSVRRNLDVAFIGSSTPLRERASLRRAALEQVGVTVPERAKAHTLSGGERQRVAIARLVIRRPTVVFADEPTAALDVETGRDVLDRLSALRSEGAALVVATHDPAVTAWADAVLDLGDSSRGVARLSG